MRQTFHLFSIEYFQNGETALHMAAGVKDGHKCAELIIKSGADVNARNEV